MHLESYEHSDYPTHTMQIYPLSAFVDWNPYAQGITGSIF